MDVLAGAGLCHGPRTSSRRLRRGRHRNHRRGGEHPHPYPHPLSAGGDPLAIPISSARCRRTRRGTARRSGGPSRASRLRSSGTSSRAALLGVTRGRLARSPVPGPTAAWYRRLAWGSAPLRRPRGPRPGEPGRGFEGEREALGRFADALSFLFLGTCALRRFEAEGRRPGGLPLVLWSVEECLPGCRRPSTASTGTSPAPWAFSSVAPGLSGRA